MTIRFPTRRDDGSFALVLRLGMDGDAAAALSDWLVRWHDDNDSWSRTWVTGDEESTEVLRYDHDFSSAPSATVGTGGVEVRMMVRPGSRWWKDWAAKLYSELSAASPGVVLLGVESV